MAATVAGLVMAAALTITMSSRRTYTTDQNRTRINQNLRSALDLVGIEIRQAGERLPVDFPALEIVNGASGAPDELVLRRNLIDEVLPLCADLTSGGTDDEIRVADSGGSPPAGCAPLSDDSGDGFPDNVSAWRANRAAAGGSVWGYLYNPTSRLGEWFLYDGDGPTGPTWIGRGDGGAWADDHTTGQQVRSYLLEQRHYALENGLLLYRFNQDTATEIHLAAGIVDFQVQAILNDGTVLNTLDATTAWNTVRAIDVSIAATGTVEGRAMTRSVSARFFPRNVLSH